MDTSKTSLLENQVNVYENFLTSARHIPLKNRMMDELSVICQQEKVTEHDILKLTFYLLLHKYNLNKEVPIYAVTGRELEAVSIDYADSDSFNDIVNGFSDGKVSRQTVNFSQLNKQNHNYFLLEERELGENMEYFVAPGISYDMVMIYKLQGMDLNCALLCGKQMKHSLDFINQMLSHFERLLINLIDNIHMPVGEIGILDENERNRQLVQWNQTERKDAGQYTAIQRFEEMAERYPNRIAVEHLQEQFCYQELAQKVDQCAAALCAQGINRGTKVAVSMRSSANLVVSLLAIWKAGGAYVPLDPYFPQERLAYMLADSEAQLLLLDHITAATWESHAIPSLNVQALFESSTMAEGIAVNDRSEPGGLAYILYTSGSTGKPKGVEISHQALSNFLTSMSEEPGMSKEDRLLSVTSISFDISLLELFLPLTTGARVILVDRETATDGLRLTRLIEEKEPTMMQATPSTWQLLLAAGWEGSAELKILCGGESWSRELASQLQARSKEVWNMYGPTETTIWSAIHQVREQEGIIPIGRPIANTQMYVLDRHKEPVPVGVAGELYIGGEGVANGYWNRGELTEEKFVDNVFTGKDKMYGTGDLARYNAEGILECLGRMDQQVKIRGYRIELSEIESQLLQHESIENAVVVSVQVGEEAQLAAYLVRKPGMAWPGHQAMRQYLQRSLPEYMLPTSYMEIEKLPLTPNGKIDRKLLMLQEVNMENTGNKVLPRNTIEKMLAEIWEETLNLRSVGVYDNFFELGGHSLAATKMMVRINRIIQGNLSLSVIFNSPTIDGLAQFIHTLGNNPLAEHEIRATSKQERTKPSFAQDRVLFLNQLLEEKYLYNVPFFMELTGELNPFIVEECILEIVKRHEVLRSAFTSIGGFSKVQVMEAEISYRYHDLSGLSEQQKVTQSDKLSQELIRMEFILDHPPLFHVALIRLERQKYMMGIVFHHIISDDWSIELFMKEFSMFYENKVLNRAHKLVPRSIQYGDYALWEQLPTQSNQINLHLEYWKKKLEWDWSALALPSDRKLVKKTSHKGDVFTFVIPKHITEKLLNLGEENNSTMYMVLLTIFQILCYKYSGQSRFLIGSPVSNRNQIETENVIGFFVNTVIISADVGGDLTFKQLLQDVRQTVLEAFEHQVPFDKLVEVLKQDHSRGDHSLIQAMFQVAPEIRLSIEGIDIQEKAVGISTSKFDIGLNMKVSNECLYGQINYRTDLFSEAWIGQFSTHFQKLIIDAVENPEIKISQLQLLSPNELKTIAIQADAEGAHFAGANVVDLFEKQARETPQHIAATYELETITYEQLNQDANQIAHFLVGQQTNNKVDIVGICIERSIDMITALLGVLKAGMAYLPLDPAIPKQRLQYQLQDSGVEFVLTSGFSDAFFSIKDAIRTIDVKSEWIRSQLDNQPTTNPTCHIEETDLVYLIYTSGSTGYPKGVMVEHRNLMSYLSGTQKTIRLEAVSSYATVSTLAADLGNTMIFHSLISGGVLHVISKERVSDPEQFAAYFRSNPVDCLKIVPSHLNFLLSASEPKDILPKRRIVLGGEALLWEQVDMIWSLQPDCEVINHYGPTETTIGVATHTLKQNMPRYSSAVPLGYPIANTEFYILDEAFQPVPRGVRGELYVSGPSLSRGYRNQDEMTARNYVTFEHLHDSKRLYRTGDWIRQLPDYSVEYLGRQDDQVKIRGYRIEIPEIVSAYTKHHHIRSIYVQIENHQTHELVAYIVSDHPNLLHLVELRDYGLLHLPNYMVPAKFYILDVIPLTMNGKVDTFALAKAPGIKELKPQRQKDKLTEDEQRIRNIWAEILQLQPSEIGLYDNFFVLGGHSLLATQVISRIRKEWGKNIPLSFIFEYATIFDLTKKVVSTDVSSTSASQEQLVKVQTNGKLSSAQQRLWFLDQLEGNTALYNVPKVVRIEGDFQMDVMARSLKKIVKRHEILRTIYEEVCGEPVQTVQEDRDLPIVVMDLRKTTNSRQCGLDYLKNEAKVPFNLKEDSLIRAYMIQTQDFEFLFMLNFHHIVVDAWSLSIIFKEIEYYYGEQFNGEQHDSFPEPLQYEEFIKLEQYKLNNQYIKEQLRYWKSTLEGSNANVTLPTDHARPGKLSTHGYTHYISVSDQLYTDLIHYSRSQGVSLFTTTLSAFGVLMYTVTEQEEICIGTPIANRTDKEVEGIVGFFVNTVVIKMELSSNPTFEQLLRRIQRRTLEAYDHADVSFEQLTEMLLEERNPAYSPFFQIMFETSKELMLNLPHVVSIPEHLDAGTSKFDLSINIIEQSNNMLIALEYNTDLYDKETIHLFSDKYIRILESVMANPDQRLRQFSSSANSISAKELDELWN
ncbi:amino acid adenylation domain-containing protein [Paenibacillus sp. QZ-Y1]|uniref:amino acid adenylation domain-containing protein n=1 Tax=Paenibacillus sp. QZ-Y1 TaxID=3414511 RepID=UPI003F790A07